MKPLRWVTLILAVALVAFGIGDKERGNRLYRAGKYAEAAAAYAQALKQGDDSPALHYDYATALLRLGRYDEADQHFRAALSNTEPGLRERTLYNYGNRYLYAARALQAAGRTAGGAPGTPGAAGPSAAPGQAGAPAAGAAGAYDPAPLLDNAVKAYEQALRIDPHDFDAKWNLELALQQKQQLGGGGGGQKKNSGGGGSGAQRNQSPQSQSNENPQPQRNQMNQAQADRILSAAENDERQLYKDKVRKGNREMQVSRDW